MTPDDSKLGRLAGSIRDLEPGSRALLDLAVRRRLGDGEIATLLGTDANYVREARAHVLETVAADLRLSPDELAQLEGTLAELPADAWLPLDSASPAVDGLPEASPNGAPGAPAVPPLVEEPEAAEAEEPQPAPAPAPDPIASPEEWPAARDGRGKRLGLIVTVGLLLLLGAGAAAVLVSRDGEDAPVRGSAPPPGPDRPGAPDGEPLPPSRGKPMSVLGAPEGVSGRARVRRGRVLLTVAGLRERRNGAYQAWLYDSVIDSEPLERLRPTVDGRFRASFDADRVKGYRFLDVSLEPFDGNNSHSGRSLLRIRTRELGLRGRGKGARERPGGRAERSGRR